MARTTRDANLETRTARGRLAVRGKPYYRSLEPGLHLGYRKHKAGAGKWVVRLYNGEEKYTVETIGTADDFSDADGVAIIDFKQAQTKARTLLVQRAHVDAGVAKPYTVAMAMEAQIEYLRNEKKTAIDAKYKIDAQILPALGHIEVARLTTEQITKWRNSLVAAAPRLRTKKGEAQKFRTRDPDDADALRARRSTAKRVSNILIAGLNRAFQAGKVPSDIAWRRVEKIKNVDSARLRYLGIKEAKRLFNACEPDFRSLVEAAALTGCRYGELCRLQVGDYNPDSGTIVIREAKSGKPRHVVLTSEGISLFDAQCVGRNAGETMFRKSDGDPWGPAHQSRLMARACKNARIDPPIGFHGLRHTWASHAIMNGVPLMVVARNLGHSDTRMVEKHYGHLAPSYVTDVIRDKAPRFGTNKPAKVRSIR